MKNIFKIVSFFVIGIVGGIFADQILWPYFIERPLFLQYRLDQSPIYITERNEIFIQENIALQQGVEKVSKAVVGIRTETKKKEIIKGSGLIVTSDGLIVTLADLLPKESETILFFGGKTLIPEVIQVKGNLALLKIKEDNLPTVDFLDFQETKLGQRVFLVGTIFSDSGPQEMVNEGIIKYFDGDLINTNISVLKGESLEGSPLFNIEGNVLGINMSSSIGEITSIPISKVRELLGF